MSRMEGGWTTTLIRYRASRGCPRQPANLRSAISAMLVASAALFAASWQPAPLVRVLNQRTPVLEIVHNPLEVVRTQRTPAIEMLLPKAVAAVFFVPWVFVVVTNNLPEEQRLKIQKSPMLQGGTKMKSMKTVRRQPSKVG